MFIYRVVQRSELNPLVFAERLEGGLFVDLSSLVI
jgi:hypothetical protein